VSVRTSCPFALNVQIGRCGHHDGARRGSDAAASLTAFEKALEWNDFGRRVDRHYRSSSGGLDEELKRQARKIPREGSGTQESELPESTLRGATPQVGHWKARMSAYRNALRCSSLPASVRKRRSNSSWLTSLFAEVEDGLTM
jgi:hypothetical protein